MFLLCQLCGASTPVTHTAGSPPAGFGGGLVGAPGAFGHGAGLGARPASGGASVLGAVAVAGAVVVILMVAAGIAAVLLFRSPLPPPQEAGRSPGEPGLDVLPLPPVAAPPAPAEPAMIWRQASPVIVDVDGDGVPDAIGYVADLAATVGHFAAFSGRDGTRLWLSERLGSDIDLTTMLVVRSGEMLLLASGGTLRGMSARDGRVLWTTQLAERVVTARDGGSSVRLELADETSVELDPRTGERTGGPVALPHVWQRECAALECAGCFERHPVLPTTSGVRCTDHFPADRLEGLLVRHAVYHPPSGVTIGLGLRSPGSVVPTLVAMRYREPPRANRTRSVGSAAPERELWRSAIAAGDPLAATFMPPLPPQVDVNSRMVVVAYEPLGKGVRATAFSLLEGARLWDVEIGGFLPNVRVTEARVFVSAGRAGLNVLDPDSGRVVARVR